MFVPNADRNCLSYANNVCVSCAGGFTLTGGQCIFQQPMQQTVTVQQTVQSAQFGCRVASPAGCIECSQGFFLSLGQCRPVSNLCAGYNPENGFCTSCFSGYTLDSRSGQCLQSVSKDKNCQEAALDGSCLKCFPSFILNVNKQCAPLNQLCATYNPSNGDCTSCYQGYMLSAGNCVIKISDPNCKVFNNDGSCKECSATFFISRGKCTRFNPLCATTNPNNGDCLSCYPGYVLNQGNCSIGSTVTIQNCRIVENGQCTQCANNFFKAPNNTCVQISPLCATADPQSGNCLSCYQGYGLQNGACVINPAIANCRQTANNLCAECSTGFFLQNGGCIQISPLCATADPRTGSCVSCYAGYSLSRGECTVSRQDANCRKYNNNQCVECSQGYMMINGACAVINTLCRTVDPSNGNCQTCYAGYELAGGNCIIPQNNDPNCIQKSSSTCLYCQNGYWLSNNLCTPLSRKCQTYDMNTGFCTSCSPSFRLVNADCVGSPSSTDPNCVSADPSGRCTGCIPNFYLSRNGLCTLVSILCL